MQNLQNSVLVKDFLYQNRNFGIELYLTIIFLSSIKAIKKITLKKQRYLQFIAP